MGGLGARGAHGPSKVTKETKRIRIKDKLSTELRSDIAINYFATLPAPERSFSQMLSCTVSQSLSFSVSQLGRCQETSEKLKLFLTARGWRVECTSDRSKMNRTIKQLPGFFLDRGYTHHHHHHQRTNEPTKQPTCLPHPSQHSVSVAEGVKT